MYFEQSVYKLSVFALFWCVCICGFSQAPKVYKAKRAFPYVQLQLGIGSTLGEKAGRVPFPKQVGIGVGYKWKSNWAVVADWNFLFSNTTGLQGDLQPFMTADSFLINNEGILEDPIPNYRGNSFHVGFRVPIWSHKEHVNSSVFISPRIGWAYTYFFYRVEDPRRVSLMQDPYLKGLDKLRAGYLAEVQVGYDWRTNNNLRNFSIQYQFQMHFSESQRTYQFDNLRETPKRTDVMHSIIATWNLPFTSKRITEEGILY